MQDSYFLIQNNFPHIAWSFSIIIILLILHKWWKIREIIKIDKNYKETNSKGDVIKHGHPRNIWDYSFFPGLGNLFYGSQWQVLLAATLILIFFFTYLYTKNNAIFNLLQISFGVAIGMMLESGRGEKGQKK